MGTITGCGGWLWAIGWGGGGGCCIATCVGGTKTGGAAGFGIVTCGGCCAAGFDWVWVNENEAAASDAAVFWTGGGATVFGGLLL